MRARILGAAALGFALALAPGASLAQASDAAEGYGDGYQAGDYGRVRYEENRPSIVRAAAEDGRAAQDPASLNTPIFPGDSVRTAGDQRLDLEFAEGGRLRVDRAADVTFQALPTPRGKYRDNVVIALRSGAIQISAHVRDDEEFRIDTEAASVYLLGDVDVRVEVVDRHGTVVAARHGVAEVVGAGGSVLVRGGSRTEVRPGLVPDEPRAYRAFDSDDFDRWCQVRDDADRPAVRARGDRDDSEYRASDLPDEVRPYYRELSSYGGWVTVPDYGLVWYPHGVGADWRPYWDGSWYYGPSGYFWVSNEPWGWCPYRYGRWNWVGGYGWCWIPGHVYAGAWVSWSWGSAYVGWAPLDYWGRPCYVGGYRWGYYDPSCWTFVNVNNVYVYNGPRYAVPIDRVSTDLRAHAVVTRAPRVAPTRLAQSAAWRESAVRQASEDRAARMRVPTREASAADLRLPDLESRLGRRAGRPPASRDGGVIRTPGGPSPSSGRPVRATDGARQRADDSGRDGRGAGEGITVPRDRYPRRILEDPRAGGTRTGGVSPPSERAIERGSSRTRVAAGDAPAAGGTSDRVRTLYDRESRPRETQQRPRQFSDRSGDPGQRTAPLTKEPERGMTRESAPRGREVYVPRTVTPRAGPSAPRIQAPPPSRAAPPAPRPQPQRQAPREGGKR